eukprot:CAMPEP_0195011706 /NCGR_PEP_ID=MMETSP0326_2-20130528/11193_1 /TAXON_ID=2866 ORGANISM="Crypthecodinium cohnii, Strain Seligo" /NCGR_SAMPLE_ID=MMETSP0326_2 /ASSEMBLY_ACC=CAM_ASM_000348 /LENGTH=97 /DNA_ID=CAMNT_0040020973 /DNA_START=601 /DNA_END=891 /DNA_ORIENTATION=-
MSGTIWSGSTCAGPFEPTERAAPRRRRSPSSGLLLMVVSSSLSSVSPTACSIGAPPKSSAPVIKVYTMTKCVAVGKVALTRATLTDLMRAAKALYPD